MSEGTLHTVDCEPIEFANEFFIKGKMEMIQKIKRKDAKPRPNTSHVSKRNCKHSVFRLQFHLFSAQLNGMIQVHNKQLTDLLQDLQNQQQQTHRDFERLKERNQELWRQVGSLRKKHDKQQDTVNRLISFMIHFIQQTPVSITALHPTVEQVENQSLFTNSNHDSLRHYKLAQNGQPHLH